MKGDIARGVVTCLIGVALILGRELFDAPWVVGVAFLLLGTVFLVRGARWRTRSPDDGLIDQAFALSASDSVASEQILGKVFAARAESDRQELARLEHEARGSPIAARELRRRLQETLRQRADATRHFKLHMANDSRLPSVLRNIDEANVQTSRLLAEVETRLKELQP